MTKHTPTPWTYRPNKHDDWGWIRDADGSLAATARDGRVHSERFDEFRAAKRDPYEANAAFIVKAVNSHDALVQALRDSHAALIAFKDAVEASQKMNGREYVGLGIQVNNAIATAETALALPSQQGKST